MKIYDLTSDGPLGEFEQQVLALGFFDGLHKGHRKLFYKSKVIAKQLSVCSSVLTFDVHPSEVLFNDKERKYLTPLPKKLSKIASCGIDATYVVNFDKSFANLSPTEFVENYIVRMNTLHVVVGFDFTFGKKASGDVRLLEKLSVKYGFELTVIPEETLGIEKISSTATRQLISDGHVSGVASLLGERYEVTMYINNIKDGAVYFELHDKYILPPSNIYVVNMRANERWETVKLILEDNTIYISTSSIYEQHYTIGNQVTIEFVEKFEKELVPS